MDIQRKMTCVLAENSPGGVAKIMLNSNGVYHREEITLLNWVLPDASEYFELGASYGIAVWMIAPPKGTSTPDAR